MEIPKLLYKKSFVLKCVAFVAAFSFVFMAIYKPFSETVWFSFSEPRNFLITVLFYIIAAGFLSVSRSVMCVVKAAGTLTIRHFVPWALFELLVIAIQYLAFTYYFDLAAPGITLMLVLRTFFCVLLILSIPYLIVVLYAAYSEKEEELALIRLGRESNRLPENKLVHLYDSNGVLKMSVNEESIYYVDSQDNYVQIHYELEGKMQHYMLRCKTQKLEEQLAGTHMVRCHRSYIVNTLKIGTFRNDHDHGVITLSNADATKVPVSKSYYKTIVGLLVESETTKN